MTVVHRRSTFNTGDTHANPASRSSSYPPLLLDKRRSTQAKRSGIVHQKRGRLYMYKSRVPPTSWTKYLFKALKYLKESFGACTDGDALVV